MDTVTRNKTIKLIGINEAEIRTSISDLIDNENVNIFFMFLCPEDKTQEYLKVLARISRLIRDDKFIDKLLKAESNGEIIEIIRDAEING